MYCASAEAVAKGTYEDKKLESRKRVYNFAECVTRSAESFQVDCLAAMDFSVERITRGIVGFKVHLL